MKKQSQNFLHHIFAKIFLFVLGLMFIPASLSGIITADISTCWAIAQWGDVKTYDGSVPDTSHLTFISFIEGTDDVIRTEDSDGAIYEK